MLSKSDLLKWRYYALIFCAILLVINVLNFDHEPLRMMVSDTVAGVAVALLAIAALIKPKKWIDWALALVALYLLLAPIILWSKTPAAYLNDSFIGALIFAFAVLFAPGEKESEDGSGIPSGWSFNPSRGYQRLPVISLAFLAYLFSRYMAFYQLGYISSIWDPVFGDGTHAVITSSISQAIPVPDAGLGSWVYAVEVLLGIHGSRKRWHTIPWFVTFFAILVIPAGLVSVLLITLQPLVVGAYCFWCLTTALCMLFMIAFAADEVIATFLFLKSVRRRGGSVRHAFWHGDPYFETRSEIGQEESVWEKLFHGISFPWTLVLSALIGFGMMFFQNPELSNPDLKSIEAVIGALVITFSVISFGEVLRSLRFVNILLGLLFGLLAIYSHSIGVYYHIFLGLLIVLLALPKGKIHYSYGEWNKYIK